MFEDGVEGLVCGVECLWVIVLVAEVPFVS